MIVILMVIVMFVVVMVISFSWWKIEDSDSQGNVIDAHKIITDPTIYAKHVILN